MAETGDITVLNTLTTTLIDSANGYRDAAAHAESTRFQELFRQFGEERSQIVEALRTEIRRLGGDPSDDGSILGKAHQRFLDLKAALTGRDDQAIVNEVERGEDYLKEKFETALESDEIGPDTRTVIETAYRSVREGHDRVSALKHGMEA